MATIDAIGTAIGVRAETLAGMRAQQEWGEAPNVSGNAMVAVVEYAGTVYDAAMGGQGDAVNYTVTVLAAKVSDRAGRLKLAALCDPTAGSTTSLREAVNGSLGGLVAFATVVSNTGFKEYQIGSGEDAPTYLGCEFTVSVAT